MRGGDGLYKHFLEHSNRVIGVVEVFEQSMKLFQILGAISGSKHHLPGKESVFHRVARGGAFSPRRSGPGGAKRVFAVGQDFAFRYRPFG